MIDCWVALMFVEIVFVVFICFLYLFSFLFLVAMDWHLQFIDIC